jgi:hypothetical protein
MRASKFTFPTMPTLRPKLRKDLRLRARRRLEANLKGGQWRRAELPQLIGDRGRAGWSERFAARPQGAPWGRAARSTGEFSIGTSGENYSGINNSARFWRCLPHFSRKALIGSA